MAVNSILPHLLTGKAKLAAVLGDPVSHSRSPRLHGYWLAQNGIDGAYVPLHVKEGTLPEALRALQQFGFAGCNLTIPHKEAALPLVDVLDEAASSIGAVNTIQFIDGKIHGRNTDAEGFINGLTHALEADGNTLEDYLTHTVVLGAGGAARAVIYGLQQAGAERITILNRTHSRAETLAHEFAPLVDAQIEAVAWDQLPTLLPHATLLVNTTALGMHGQPPLEIDLSPLPQTALVTDIVYTPLRTPLLEAANAHGCRTVDGLHMLIHQARAGFAAWFGHWPEITPDLHEILLGSQSQ
jgi:shikimate dehydrogenase